MPMFARVFFQLWNSCQAKPMGDVGVGAYSDLYNIQSPAQTTQQSLSAGKRQNENSKFLQNISHTVRPKKVTFRMLLESRCICSFTSSRHTLCLEIVFFGRFLLRLSRIKCSQVISMGKVGHTELNFAQDLFVNFLGTSCIPHCNAMFVQRLITKGELRGVRYISCNRPTFEEVLRAKKSTSSPTQHIFKWRCGRLGKYVANK